MIVFTQVYDICATTIKQYVNSKTSYNKIQASLDVTKNEIGKC